MIKALFPFSAKATDDTFGPGSASFRYKQKALAFKIKVVLGFLKMVKNTPFLYPIILFLDDIITSMVLA